jgi:hypothetical protein
MGRASVIHQVAIHAVNANMRFASEVNPSALTKKRMQKKTRGPANKPIRGSQLFMGLQVGGSPEVELAII